MAVSVWDRLYEDGLDKMEARFIEEDQPFSFQPEIGETSDFGPPGEVFDRLYDEGLQRKELKSMREDEEKRRFPFRPNNSKAFDQECWNRLYDDGMQTLQKLERRRREPTNEAMTFKPKVTEYTLKNNEGAVFDRLYEEARAQRQDKARRRAKSLQGLKEQYGFRPHIVSHGETRGDAVFEALYRDAKEKRLRAEELAMKVAAEREGRHSPSTEAEEPKQPRRPVPAPVEEAVGPFVPRTNDVRGVAPRYLQPRRTFVPVYDEGPAPNPRFGGRQPWISPLEAMSMEARLKERGPVGGAARRSRSASGQRPAPPFFEESVEDSMVDLHEHRGRVAAGPSHSAQPRGRALSASASTERYMQPTLSSALRSPGSPSPSKARFRYVPQDETALSYEDQRMLEFDKGDAFRSDHVPGLGPPEHRGLRSYAPAHTQAPETMAAAFQPSPPREAPRNFAPGAPSAVTRTVDRQARVVDLT